MEIIRGGGRTTITYESADARDFVDRLHALADQVHIPLRVAGDVKGSLALYDAFGLAPHRPQDCADVECQLRGGE